MKKYFLFIALTLIFIIVIPSFAQVELGFLGGVSSTSFDGSYKQVPSIDAVSNGSFSIGAIFIYNFTENIGIQLEPAYCEKGGTNGISGINKAEISIGYVDIPILIKYSFDVPYVILGVYNSYTTGALYKYREEDNNRLTEVTEGIEKELKDIDTGICFGLGANIETGRGKIIVEAQYSRGFSVLLDDDINGSLKNQGFHLKVGMLFSL